jgi:hypothetical protein
MSLFVFRMLTKRCRFNTEKYPDWSHTMRPDAYRHRPQHWGRNGFAYKAKDPVKDQKHEYYPNDDYSFIPSHLFTIGAPLEAISHTLGKMLSSVT